MARSEHSTDRGEVRAFACGLLAEGLGVATDDFTDHLWTREEILGGVHRDGHPFFDCDGWLAERSHPRAND